MLIDRRNIVGDKLLLIFEENEDRETYLRLQTQDGASIGCRSPPDSAWFSTSYLMHLYRTQIKPTDPDLQYTKVLENKVKEAAKDMFMEYRKKHKKRFL